MTQLHEILAVENDLGKQAKKLLISSKKQFDKENLFSGFTKTLEMFDEKDAHLNSTESLKLETTVDENLAYALDSVIKHYDITLQKDAANQKAVADIVIDGNVLVKAVPATTLLGLESKLTELRQLFETIPTLQPGIVWNSYEADPVGVFRTQDPVVQFKTKNVLEYLTVQPVTVEHPAQVETFTVVKNIGKYSTTKVSGMYTAHRKAQVLSNLDVLLRAIKKARQRANNVEVDNRRIGKQLINYIINK